MIITQDINVYQFRQMFANANRQENFSYKGLGYLFDHLESLNDDIGEPIELDVVALCCDYTELRYDDVISNYRLDVSECEDTEDQLEVIREYLSDNTSLVGEFEDEDGIATFLFQVF